MKAIQKYWKHNLYWWTFLLVDNTDALRQLTQRKLIAKSFYLVKARALTAFYTTIINDVPFFFLIAISILRSFYFYCINMKVINLICLNVNYILMIERVSKNIQTGR